MAQLLRCVLKKLAAPRGAGGEPWSKQVHLEESIQYTENDTMCDNLRDIQSEKSRAWEIGFPRKQNTQTLVVDKMHQQVKFC